MKNFFKKLFCSDSMSKHFSETVKRVGKNNAGFSLVELIVVIAIMAILAAVAVIGVSVYIPKAQQANDKQMFADIEDALIYAGYAGTFEEGQGGYIILSVNGIENEIAEGSPLDKALADAFGTSYENDLKLAYDSWGNNYLFIGLLGAQDVYNSTYYGVSDQLMGQVKDITDAALSILGTVGSGNNRNDMIGLFAGEGEAEGESEFLSQVAQQYGYADISEVPDEALPNLLVLAVATDVTTEKNNPDGHEMSDTSGLIKDFALFNGYAATEQGKAEGFDEKYNEFVAALESAQNIDDVANAYKTLRDATKESSSGYSAYAAGQGQTDVEAFDAMLAGLASSTANNAELTKQNLARDDFFTEGVGNSLFNSYIDSVESFIGFDSAAFAQDMLNDDDTIKEGVVAIYFTYVNSEMVINSSLLIN